MVKAGILGGGQLGRMLLQQAANYPVTTYVLENDPDCPAAHLCSHFEKGDIRNFEDVYRFGKKVDVLTIEIESVNVEALEKLEAEGILVFPKPEILRMLKNKIRQKEFYAGQGHPTADFQLVNAKNEVLLQAAYLPFAQKLAEGGYDGRGVQLMRESTDLDKAFDEPGILEKLVDVDKELAVIVGIDAKGNNAVFPPVEMIFDDRLNLLDYQVCPANIDDSLVSKAKEVALNVATSFQSAGLFAIELFLNKEGQILVNETAPRVHNSGHHTIEANFCSQYDMLWRIMLGYPLGNTGSIMYSALVNLVGENGFSGDVEYQGLRQVLEIDNAYVHLYGKKQTKPGRKMGHVTLLGSDRIDLNNNVHAVKQLLKVVSKTI